MKRFCLTLDLKDDPLLIREYDAQHREVWPEIKESIRSSGTISMEIYRVNTRLVMIMETTDSFSFEKKDEADKNNDKVQKWEDLMWKYQQKLPWSKPGEKWVLMEMIFSL